MDAKQTRAVLVTFLLVVLAWLGAAVALSRRESPPPLSSAALRFDAIRALDFTRELVTRHPRRVLGSIESRQSTGTLKRLLDGMGYTVEFAHFDAVIAGRRQTGRNLLAVRRGSGRGAIVVAAHYDTAPTTMQGATDDGSGVGVLLELARLWSTEQPRRSVLFLLSDGGEWGNLGARDFAVTFPERGATIAAVSLDYLAGGELGAEVLDFAGQERGYAPPWLREVGRGAAQAAGPRAAGPSVLQEQLERALQLSWNDAGAFLGAGVPSLNLGSLSKNRAEQARLYHSRFDTIGNLLPVAMQEYGRTAETLLRTLDEIPATPQTAPAAVRIGSSRYLREGVVAALHWLTFLPLAAALWFHAANRGIRGGRALPELLAYAGTLLPLALGYAAIFVCSRVRMLPRYTYHPGAVRDPALERVSWAVVVTLLLVVVTSAVILAVARRVLARKLPEPEFFASKTVELAVLLATAVLALAYNSYWAAVFLALPAWMWSLVTEGDEVGGRAANRLAIAGAGIVALFATVYLARMLDLEWRIFWYEILALSTGLFSGKAALLAASTVAVGIRMWAIQSQPASRD
jgi:acetylornithine deacetylase/succinyl-diaminopimelate desuccinylase-like protein